MVLRDNVNRHFWLSQQIFIYHIHILNKAINLETGSIYKPVLKRGIPATSEYFTCRISYTIDNKVNNNLQFTKNLNFLTTFFITLVINCGLSFVFNTHIYTHTYTRKHHTTTNSGNHAHLSDNKQILQISAEKLYFRYVQSFNE